MVPTADFAAELEENCRSCLRSSRLSHTLVLDPAAPCNHRDKHGQNAQSAFLSLSLSLSLSLPATPFRKESFKKPSK
jgi:hypothetical protein